MIKSHYTINQRIYDRMLKQQDRYNRLGAELLQNYPEQNMQGIMEQHIEALVKESTRNNGSQLAWRCLKCASDLGRGVFESNANDGVAFPFAYDGEYLEVTGKKTDFSTGEPNWFKSLQCAVSVRDSDAISYLMTVRNEVLSQSSMGDQMREFDYARLDLYRAIFTGGNIPQALIRTVKAFNPDEYCDVAFYYARRIKWPLIAVIEAIFTDSEAEYNIAMKEAILLHKEYYNRTGDRLYDVMYDGAISMPLTALAIIAKDTKGYSLTVDNEYIPMWIVDRIPPPAQ